MPPLVLFILLVAFDPYMNLGELSGTYVKSGAVDKVFGRVMNCKKLLSSLTHIHPRLAYLVRFAHFKHLRFPFRRYVNVYHLVFFLI